MQVGKKKLKKIIKKENKFFYLQIMKNIVT